MIKEKFLKFVSTFFSRFLFLLEVIVRLRVGTDKEENKEDSQDIDGRED